MTSLAVQATSRPHRVLRQGLVILGGVALMTIAAKTQLPSWPVPMTLHTLAVLAFAVLAGPRTATAIFLSYLAAGAAGLPVFSGTPERGLGIAYMAGPTGGYLAGYLAASWLVGVLSRERGLLGHIGAMLIGLIVIYGLGVAWLAFFAPSAQLLSLGVAPFLAGDLLKLGVVAAVAALLPTRRRGPHGAGK